MVIGALVENKTWIKLPILLLSYSCCATRIPGSKLCCQTVKDCDCVFFRSPLIFQTLLMAMNDS